MNREKNETNTKKKKTSWYTKIIDLLTSGSTIQFCGNEDSYNRNLLKLYISEFSKEQPSYFDMLTGAID